MLYFAGLEPSQEFELKLEHSVPLAVTFSPQIQHECCRYARYGNGQSRFAEIGVNERNLAIKSFTLLSLTSNVVSRKLDFELYPLNDCQEGIPKLSLRDVAKDSQEIYFDFFDDKLTLLCGSQNSRILLYPDTEAVSYVDSNGIEFGFSSDKLLVSIGLRGIGWQLAEVVT